ncbi:MAG: FR47-like protein [Verrucomicrobiota bacterium]
MSGLAASSPPDPELGISWQGGRLSLWLGRQENWRSRCDLYFSEQGAALFNLETEISQQRRGYARRLLRCAQNELLKRGESRLILKVGSENQAAVNLYRSLGLQESGRYWFRMSPK